MIAGQMTEKQIDTCSCCGISLCNIRMLYKRMNLIYSSYSDKLYIYFENSSQIIRNHFKVVCVCIHSVVFCNDSISDIQWHKIKNTSRSIFIFKTYSKIVDHFAENYHNSGDILINTDI